MPPSLPERDKGSPWPAGLDGLGEKQLGPFTPCLWCDAGTWVRYAGLPFCLACARSWPDTRTPAGARARLWHLLDLWAGMDEAERTPEEVDALKESVLDIFRAHPEAEAWYREWRAAHPEARLC